MFLYAETLLNENTNIGTGRFCAMSRECSFKFFRNLDYSGRNQMIGSSGYCAQDKDKSTIFLWTYWADTIFEYSFKSYLRDYSYQLSHRKLRSRTKKILFEIQLTFTSPTQSLHPHILTLAYQHTVTVASWRYGVRAQC